MVCAISPHKSGLGPLSCDWCSGIDVTTIIWCSSQPSRNWKIFLLFSLLPPAVTVTVFLLLLPFSLFEAFLYLLWSGLKCFGRGQTRLFKWRFGIYFFWKRYVVFTLTDIGEFDFRSWVIVAEISWNSKVMDFVHTQMNRWINIARNVILLFNIFIKTSYVF